jgi:hypothetical protein
MKKISPLLRLQFVCCLRRRSLTNVLAMQRSVQYPERSFWGLLERLPAPPESINALW